MNRIKKWWKESTSNEKMMYGLVAVLIIGILTRWKYVWKEIADAFVGIFS